MDRAVLDAYGWQDIQPECGFHEQLDESIRYGWDETTKAEVLGRLLALNELYFKAEQPAATR